jgi:hypothetical protein
MKLNILHSVRYAYNAYRVEKTYVTQIASPRHPINTQHVAKCGAYDPLSDVAAMFPQCTVPQISGTL